jgi:hypothetical protein
MNSVDFVPNFLRFVGLTALQVLLFKQISLSVGPYFNIFAYPLFIILLPLAAPTPLAIFLGFLIGLCVDLFYGTLGVHASAGAFTGLFRTFLLNALEPKGGYSGKELIPAPYYFDWQWFFYLSGILMFLHCFWFFSVDAFTFVYIGGITLKTLAGWALSMLFIALIVFLFNPKR